MLVTQHDHTVKRHALVSPVSRPRKADLTVEKELLDTYSEEVLTGQEPVKQTDLNELNEPSFAEKLKELEELDVPLISQTARKEAVWPVLTTEQRKRVIDICRRVKRNEGTMVICRLSSEKMDDELMLQLCSSLRENKCLQQLMLHNNSITDASMLPFCRAVRLHPTLNSIWIGKNQISDEGASSLAFLIEKNPRIKELNLSNKWPALRWLKTEHRYLFILFLFIIYF